MSAQYFNFLYVSNCVLYSDDDLPWFTMNFLNGKRAFSLENMKNIDFV